MGITPAIPAIPLSFSVSAAVLLPLDSVSLVTYQAGYYKITDMFKPGHHLGGPGCHHRGRHVPYRKASRSDVALRPFTGESMPSAPESAILTATIPGINQMWAQLLFLAAKQEHARGTYRYLYDDPEHSFYFLEKGRVTILHGATNGRVQDMLYMQSGTLFNVSLALGSSLTHFLDAGCQFYCLTNVTVWKFPGSLLHDQDFIRSHPAFIENPMSSIGLKLLLMHNTLSNSGTAPPLKALPLLPQHVAGQRQRPGTFARHIPDQACQSARYPQGIFAARHSEAEARRRTSRAHQRTARHQRSGEAARALAMQ